MKKLLIMVFMSCSISLIAQDNVTKNDEIKTWIMKIEKELKEQHKICREGQYSGRKDRADKQDMYIKIYDQTYHKLGLRWYDDKLMGNKI